MLHHSCVFPCTHRTQEPAPAKYPVLYVPQIQPPADCLGNWARYRTGEVDREHAAPAFDRDEALRNAWARCVCAPAPDHFVAV